MAILPGSRAKRQASPRGHFFSRYHDEVPKTLALARQERVFGVPIFVVEDKRFWGNDRIEFLLEELRG